MSNTDPQLNNHTDIEVANRIMNAIVTKGSSLTALAATAGISYSNLRRSLHQERKDRRSFKVNELANIAHALNIPAAALLPETNKQAAA